MRGRWWTEAEVSIKSDVLGNLIYAERWKETKQHVWQAIL